MSDYSKIRDVEVRDLLKIKFGICKRCINKMTKKECITLLNMREDKNE